jgi:hypothetical protein
MTIDALRAGLRVVEVEVDLRHNPTGRDLSGLLHRARQARAIAREVTRRRAWRPTPDGRTQDGTQGADGPTDAGTHGGQTPADPGGPGREGSPGTREGDGGPPQPPRPRLPDPPPTGDR